MNFLVERLEELREQGEMVSRISPPLAGRAFRYVCRLTGPFGFSEAFVFAAANRREATHLWVAAHDWIFQNFLRGAESVGLTSASLTEEEPLQTEADPA